MLRAALGAALRLRNFPPLHEALNQYFSTRTSNEWIEALNNAGVPCGPINQIDQVFADEQVKHLGMAKPISHPILGDTRYGTAASQEKAERHLLHAASATHGDVSAESPDPPDFARILEWLRVHGESRSS